MATKRDYYELLDISRDAADEQIKRAYRKMAMRYHPDRNPGDADAERIFKESAEAYEVLTDPNKRQRYDQYGHAGLRGTSMNDFGHMDVGDIFSRFDDMFGGGGRTHDRARRGHSLETEVEVTLAEAAKEVERDIEFTCLDTCDTCHGTGAAPGSKPIACVTCGGQGQVAQAGLGGMFRMVSTCPACGGAGKVVRAPCRTCKGNGRTPKKRVLQVKIPAGIHDGQTIRVAAEGEPGTRGGPRGDLHVMVRVSPHDLFTREDDHLVLRMPISFTQAALGAKVQVPTLDGQHELTIKPSAQHGDEIRVTGKGMPNLRHSGRGDLVAVMLVEIPKKLTDLQKNLLRQFAETEDHNVMPHSKGFWDKIKTYLS